MHSFANLSLLVIQMRLTFQTDISFVALSVNDGRSCPVADGGDRGNQRAPEARGALVCRAPAVAEMVWVCGRLERAGMRGAAPAREV